MATRDHPSSRSPREKAPPFTVEHFTAWAKRLTLDSGARWELEDFQKAIVADVFGPAGEVWILIGEGNAKTTLLAGLALYGAQYSQTPWIPIGAASRDQAEIMFGQAAGFVERSAALRKVFRVYHGYRKITALRQGGRGIKVYPADARTGDGVIPFPYALIDELHRHDDLRLYRLWRGKLNKRGSKVVIISTAGEPGGEFEEVRERIRRSAPDRVRDGAHLRAAGPSLVLHEWVLGDPDAAADMGAVKLANPFSGITEATLREEFESATTDLPHWLRMKCGIAARGAESAITDAEWDGAQTDDEIPEGAHVAAGLDVAWKWDCTALVPVFEQSAGGLLVGAPAILTPPRDGTMLSSDRIKEAVLKLHERNPVDTLVMDTSRAEDVAQWVADEIGCELVDRGQSNQFAVADFDALTNVLRNGRLRHDGDAELRRHVLNAIARRLPGGDLRFDRPSTSRSVAGGRQDRRVVDALTALGMVVQVVESQPERAKLLGWL